MTALDTKKISRRKLLMLGVPAMGALCLPGFLSCNDKNKQTTNNAGKGKQASTTGRDWTKDELYLHTKTKALHYPALFKGYKMPPDKFIQKFPVLDWERLLDQEKAHFTKDRSAPIFEALALRELQKGINDATLSKSSTVLARSFAPEYALQNKFNWRGHDLLLQLIALDGSKAKESKYSNYKELVKSIDLASIKKIPKRNAWIQAEAEFNKRVDLILGKKEDFLKKLSSRV